jgi:hypothetical protein
VGAATAAAAQSAGSCRRLIHLRLCFWRSLRLGQLATLAVLADAFFNWGFFPSCLMQSEIDLPEKEPRGDVAEIYSHVVTRCTELAAGAVAERILLEGEPVPSVSDVEQAVGLASLCCRSAEAVERFLAFCEQQAFDLLRPYAPVIMSLSIVLRIKRTLDAHEIDNVIATTLARFELAAEQARRRQWQQCVANAGQFKSDTLQR